jgi:hypothetical protein
MNAQTNLPSLQVIAHHEAGHAVAGMVLGVEFTAVRIVRGEDGKIGVPLKTNPWIAPRPAFKPPDEFTDEEWAKLLQSDEKWEAWKKKDNDNYAIFCLAGKAAQLEYAGVANDEDTKADYSFIAFRLPHCQLRIRELEQAARELVRSHWPAVQAIAEELLNRSELTPIEVEDIFKNAMPTIQVPKAREG